MDPVTSKQLSDLIHSERIAHLGTLRAGAPMVSMTLFIPQSGFTGTRSSGGFAADRSSGGFSAFYVHVSRLAWHTQDMLQDPRVALSIAQTDDGRPDPFTFGRVTIRGEALQI